MVSERGSEGEGGLTSVELVCYFLFALFFIENEELVSVGDVNAV